VGNVWFVAVSGRQTYDGSKEWPWSLEHAASGAGGHIQPADTVHLREGRYRTGKGPKVTVSGAPGMPITFCAYPGETPVLDGSFEEFWRPPHPAWARRVVSPRGDHIYVSRTQHPVSPEYGGLIKLPEGTYGLATHPSVDFLASDDPFYHATDPRYLGPGIAYNPSDQRLYIRLDNCPREAQAGRTTVTQIRDPDPNRYAIFIAPIDHHGLRISGSHLVFKRIHVQACHTCFTVEGSPADLSFIDCVCEPLRFGIRLAAATHVKILGGTYCGHMHSVNWWVSAFDIKGPAPGTSPAKAQAKRAFGIGDASDVEIGPSPKTGQRLTVSQFFDGILGGNSRDIRVHGVWFDEIWDDAWQQSTKLRNVLYYDNVHWGAGPSRDLSSSIPSDGTTYLFDNVVDTTAHEIFAFRPPTDVSPVRHPPAFSSHGGEGVSEFPWKLYHNTVVVPPAPKQWAYLDSGRVGVPRSGSGGMTSGPAHEVYNNIFVVPDGRPLSDTFDARSGLEIYDGNCLWSGGQWKVTNGPYRFVWSSAGRLNDRNPLATKSTPSTICAALLRSSTPSSTTSQAGRP
jgi:hypothetical protein